MYTIEKKPLFIIIASVVLVILLATFMYFLFFKKQDKIEEEYITPIESTTREKKEILKALSADLEESDLSPQERLNALESLSNPEK